MSDPHLVSDAMGTLHGVPHMIRWLRESVQDVGASDTDARLAGPTRALLERLGQPASDGADLDSLLGDLKSRIPVLATQVRGQPEDEVRLLLDAVEVGLRAIGASVKHVAVPDGSGWVEGVFVSDGGVPKLPVTRAEIDRRGLIDDRQTSRRHHGKPMQALCLYSAEVIDALRAEGHPINPGSTGENLNISGLDWSALRPFLRLRIGEVVAELSAPATPCAKNERWFTDGDASRMDHDLHPGWSRWYAWVLAGGTVSPGDRVTIVRDLAADASELG